jgi:tetratricopeptide (TPR) repeat protein
MDRSLARLFLSIAIGSALCLGFPIREGRALAGALAAKDSAKAKQAQQFYKEGHYEDAAKIFTELSVDYPDKPAFTRNLGACYYYLHRPEPAISNLREYLDRGKNITEKDRTEVDGWIAEMEKLREQTAAATSAAPAVVVPPPPVVAAPAVDSNQPPVVATPAPAVPPAPIAPVAAPPAPALAPAAETVAPAQPTAGQGMRIAGITCGALGLASIGTAIYFYTRATSLSDKITTSDAPSASDYQSGKTAQTMQWVFYSVGAAALATGSVLYYLGWRAAEPGQTAVAPMVGPGFAGLSAKGAF